LTSYHGIDAVHGGVNRARQAIAAVLFASNAQAPIRQDIDILGRWLQVDRVPGELHICIPICGLIGSRNIGRPVAYSVLLVSPYATVFNANTWLIMILYMVSQFYA
jgi:hypothetical protein